jgi:predicted SnoaL-like aldol condensation-catalyzing enzyme
MDFQARAVDFLENLTTKRNLHAAAQLMHERVTLQHNDLAPMSKEGFLRFWPELLEQSPDLKVTIIDTISQGLRVWVFSCVTGRLHEGPLDDIHMLQFDENGLLLHSRGVQRAQTEVSQSV